MPPAAPDDLIRQQSRSLEDETPFTPDQTRIIPEHESSGSKGKKKKNSKKAKAAARAVTETETPPDDVVQPSDPPPAEPSSFPDPSLEHHVPPTVTSPVLDVLGSMGDTADTDLTSRTDTWAQSVPFGKSPPTDLMDGEVPHESSLNFPTIQERGGFSQPSSASPPTRLRPFSYSSGYRSNMQSRQQSVDRRKSQSYGSPMSNLAPPPHLPQAHFYGAPEIDIPSHTRPVTDGAYSFC